MALIEVEVNSFTFRYCDNTWCATLVYLLFPCFGKCAFHNTCHILKAVFSSACNSAGVSTCHKCGHWVRVGTECYQHLPVGDHLRCWWVLLAYFVAHVMHTCFPSQPSTLFTIHMYIFRTPVTDDLCLSLLLMSYVSVFVSAMLILYVLFTCVHWAHLLQVSHSSL